MAEFATAGEFASTMALDYSRSRQASIAIEIDPVDATGAATKKRVYYCQSYIYYCLIISYCAYSRKRMTMIGLVFIIPTSHVHSFLFQR